MAVTIDSTLDGKNLKDFLKVTKAEIAEKLDGHALVNAASDEKKQLISRMAETQWRLLPDQMAEHVCGFLEENVVDIFATAWSQFYELKRQARETRDDKKTTMDVALADHDFTYEMEPSVELLLDGVSVKTIPFRVAMTCTVEGLILGLKQGAVYRVRSGHCNAKAEIRCAGKVVWERPLFGTNLPGELKLTKPLVLAS
jgi:hypothetical protein